MKEKKIDDICRQSEEEIKGILSTLQSFWIEQCESGKIPVDDWDAPKLDVTGKFFSAHQIRYLRELGYLIITEGDESFIVPAEEEG